MSDRYALVGNPVAHSKSPWIHAEFARASSQDLDYGLLESPLDGFAATVQRFRAAGGKGLNVTLPFKQEAFRLCRTVSERARRAQAVNTLVLETGFGDNTDGIGLVRDIERNAGVPLAGARVLLIGAGGAAAGALGPLLAAAPALLVVANRTVAKAQALVERHRGAAGGVELSARAPGDCGSGFDVVVNATASSLQGAEIPVDSRVLGPGALALDMMYGPAAQGFIGWAQARGARGRDGLGMLVEQAAEAFALWRGVTPDTAPVLAALRERLSAASR